MVSNTWLVCAIVVSALLGCTQKKEETGRETDSTKITSETILAFQNRKETATIIPKEGITEFIPFYFASELESEHYENTNGSPQTSDPDSCFSQELARSTLISSMNTEIFIKVDFVTSEACKAQEKAEAMADVEQSGVGSYTESGRFSMEVVYSCGHEVRDFGSVPVGELNVDEACGYPIGIYRSMITEGRSVLVSKKNGKITEESGDFIYQSFTMNAQGGLCSWLREGNVVIEGAGCVHGYYSKSGLDSNPTAFYFLGMKGNMAATVGPHDWYDSGSVTVDINNWQGTVTYSNRDTAPKFSLSNGMEMVEGSLHDPWTFKDFQLPQNLWPSRSLEPYYVSPPLGRQ